MTHAGLPKFFIMSVETSCDYSKNIVHTNTKYIHSSGTHWRSVREGAVSTMPQVPQNWA